LGTKKTVILTILIILPDYNRIKYYFSMNKTIEISYAAKESIAVYGYAKSTMTISQAGIQCQNHLFVIALRTK